MAEEERILEVTPDFDGKRIDQCLTASFSDCSRSFLQKLLKDGKVSINGKTQKASSKVAAGDAVLVLLPEPEELNVEPENIPLDILYEDDDLLVVNKPKGMVVHPGGRPQQRNTGQCGSVSLPRKSLRHQRRSAPRNRPQNRYGHNGCPGYL